MRAKRIFKAIVIAAAAVCLLVVVFMIRSPSDPLFYCQKQFDSAFEQWKMTNGTDVYPNIEGDSRKSFAPIGAYLRGGNTLMDHYGYVAGLAYDDPSDLVLMYLKKKTRRTWNGDHSATIFTEPKWMVLGSHVWSGDEREGPEGGILETTVEFKRRLRRTLEFLKENNRPNWEKVVEEHTAFLESIDEES